MKKDKEWLKNEINNVTSRIYGADFSTLKETDDLIDQLEPELTQVQVDKYLHERNLVAVDEMMIHQTGMQNKVVVEKPVIPKFVAEQLEYWERNKMNVLWQFWLKEVPSSIIWWLEDDVANYDKMLEAAKHGYEVEKEKLYTVDLPPFYELIKRLDRNTYELKRYSDSGLGDYTNAFTEQEIKDYDPRYWAFAEEVQE